MEKEEEEEEGGGGGGEEEEWWANKREPTTRIMPRKRGGTGLLAYHQFHLDALLLTTRFRR